MSALDVSRFREFFNAIYGKDRDPFPWQERLMARVALGEWPRVIALPTAAGKTACIDVAVFSLACQFDSGEERTAPRRIFFVVDRRVIVDQAFEHAKHIAEKLHDAKSGILQDVADNLRKLACSDYALDVFQLRGGIYRDDSWARTPLQPTVIASTVDQIGSRLLYRGYGLRSGYARPIHAGLAANDCLIILDEAHCARPFCQTTSAISKYRSWAQSPVHSPFQVVQMTATPSEDIAESVIERDQEDDREHCILGPRINASKPTKLVAAKNAKGKQWRKHLAKEIVKQAETLQTDTVRAVGVIVNQVATARQIWESLREKYEENAHVVLLTGRMRPIDRDKVVDKWLKQLQSGEKSVLEKPVYVVATQCLEVGADLDFHGLVSECCSLDALRQRFGRLNRIAARDEAPGCIVVRADQTRDSSDDPIYGVSLSKTWHWLLELATDDAIDMGVAAVRRFWDETPSQERNALNAPSVDAPVMFPSHVDCWVQTDPVPRPDPDPAIFLHGPQRGVADVNVVWRADLGTDTDDWVEILSLCPPSSSEAMPVPLPAFRNWLTGGTQSEDAGDVEGAVTKDDGEEGEELKSALRWCGPVDERTKIVAKPNDVRPGDTFVVPATAGGWESFGHIPEEGALVSNENAIPRDYGDMAYQTSRDVPMMRLTPGVVAQWPSEFQSSALNEFINNVELKEDEAERDHQLTEILASLAESDDQRLQEVAQHLSHRKQRFVEPHPSGGWVVRGRRRIGRTVPRSTFTDEDDTSFALDHVPAERGMISLAEHCVGVEQWAKRFAKGCSLSEALQETIVWAARWHDLGKADPRFQSLLQNLPPRAVVGRPLIAKSEKAPRSRRAQRIIFERSGYPKGGRHELLSVRLAESQIDHIPDSVDRDLLLHLIASHHGRCRPFAPVVEYVAEEDPAIDRVHSFQHGDCMFERATTRTGLERLDGGTAERFWLLVRRYGWWGLALLETILRLADHRRSEEEENNND